MSVRYQKIRRKFSLYYLPCDLEKAPYLLWALVFPSVKMGTIQTIVSFRSMKREKKIVDSFVQLRTNLRDYIGK